MEGKSQGGQRNRSNQRRSRQGGGGNRSRSGRGGQNRNRPQRSQNRSGGRQNPRRQPKKKSLIQKILGFFGLGGKKKQTGGRGGKSSKGAKREEVTSGRLYVGNLDYDLTEGEVEQYFAKIGKVVSAEIVTHGDSSRSKGFAFVEMSTTEEAKKAVSELDGKKLGSRPILVSGAKADKRKRQDSSGPKRSERDGDRERPRQRERSRGDRGDRGGRERGKGGGRDSGRRSREKPQIEVSPKKTVTINSTSLKLSNLDAEVTQEDLQDIFRGGAEPVQIDLQTGEGGPAAFVEMESQEAAQQMVNVLDGKRFMGRQLKFEERAEPAAVQPEPAAEEDTWSPSE